MIEPFDTTSFALAGVSQRNASAAIAAAMLYGRGSTCMKDKRGAAVFRPTDSLQLVSGGANGPPEPFVCDGSEACREQCRRVAVHAEERALHAWERLGAPKSGVHVLHIRMEGDVAAPSNEPRCETCSRTMLLSGVAFVWLWTSTGWRAWSGVEFHRQTMINLGLPYRTKL